MWNVESGMWNYCHTPLTLRVIKQGAKLQQARLIGASDAVNRRRGALAPAGVGDPPPTDAWHPPPIEAGDIDVCYSAPLRTQDGLHDPRTVFYDSRGSGA